MDSNEKNSRTYFVSDLIGKATISVDRWGIPHIRAESKRDAFFVQGFNAGRDRLWQLDIWRKRGLGKLAADFGPGFILQDKAARLFLYRGDMEREWRAYGDVDAKGTVEAFVSGLNAWIELTRSESSLLSPEFDALGVVPEFWHADDLVRIRSHARSGNIASEFARARVLAVGGSLEDDVLRCGVLPGHQITVPQGVDYAELPEEVMDSYRLAIAPVALTPERLACRLEDAGKWSKIGEFGEFSFDMDGSNAWVLAGARTASGRPILANDPHRLHSLPSLRYLVHLKAPDLNVIGAGEPSMPGIVMGHNEAAAFGLTIFPMDQEDLYIYEADFSERLRYKYNLNWEDISVQREIISVKNHPDQELELLFTRHGPVLYEDRNNDRAYALRTVWSEPGACAYLASLAYLDAENIADFNEARRHWVAPPVNHVYADISGTTGWFVSGKAPLRPNWDGLLPVSGDGRYEWSGFVPGDRLPFRIDPVPGYFVSANEYNVPSDYSFHGAAFSLELQEGSRFERITEVLDSQNGHDVHDSIRLQFDLFSLPARRLQKLLDRYDSGNPAVRKVLSLLSNWNCEIGEKSSAAALFEVWWNRYLKPAILTRMVNAHNTIDTLKPGSNTELLLIMEDNHPTLNINDFEKRELFLVSLEKAYMECQKLMGDDIDAWAWGALHKQTFVHCANTTAPLIARNVGPIPIGGSESTVCFAKYRLDDFQNTAGASFRIVVDVGDWDNSRVVNAPGQSGDPRSRHYDDHATLWRSGGTVPLLFSDRAVDAATEMLITLLPRR